MRIVISRDQLSKILDRAEDDGFLRIAFQVKENAVHKGGISIYGEREGRYPVDPTLIITTKQQIKESD